MRDILSALAADELSIAEAEAALRGYVTGENARFDAAREERRGIPEGILATDKTPKEVATLCETAVETTGHALITRTDNQHRQAIRERMERSHPAASVQIDERSAVVIVEDPAYEPPTIDVTVGIITAGTADAGPAGEAAAIVKAVGAHVARIDDVGVANLTRITDQLPRLRDFDVIIVAAGREGALPTVVAGLVDVPVIGLPISSGYGYGGNGDAALAGMLQSCTVLSVVNIDAGFVAGAQAGIIAQSIDGARKSYNEK